MSYSTCVWQLQSAARKFWRNPAFTLAALATLSLGNDRFLHPSENSQEKMPYTPSEFQLTVQVQGYGE
jgi:hypothetical protein